MKPINAMRVVTFALAFLPVCVAARDSTETAGDILAVLLPATGLGVTYVLDDEEGRWQFSKAFVASYAVTLGLKAAVDKERPDGSDNDSFPSGHATGAFQAAHFIRKRYGWSYGLPAYLGATYVAYSRVEARKHDNADVLAGAVIGMAGSEYFTRRWPGISVAPTSGGRGLVISLNRQF